MKLLPLETSNFIQLPSSKSPILEHFYNKPKHFYNSLSFGAALASTAAARHGGTTSEALGTGPVAATAGGIALGATGWAGGAGAAGSLLGEALGDRGPAEDSSSLEVLSGEEVRWAASGSAATGRSACTAVLGTATCGKGMVLLCWCRRALWV